MQICVQSAMLASLSSNTSPPKKTPIPYLDYVVNYTHTPGVTNIPLPYFEITSDGWFNNFKQSIVTTIMPKSSVPLFDFTIIQQQ